MRELYTEIEIDAPAATVWRILTDFQSYPQWHPTFRRISGRLEAGARIEFVGDVGGGLAMTIKPTLLVVQPEKELRWLGHMVAPGVFDGEHRFELTARAPDRTHFVQAERFTGALVLPFMAAIGRKTRDNFEAANRALKARAEAFERGVMPA